MYVSFNTLKLKFMMLSHKNDIMTNLVNTVPRLCSCLTLHVPAIASFVGECV